MSTSPPDGTQDDPTADVEALGEEPSEKQSDAGAEPGQMPDHDTEVGA